MVTSLSAERADPRTLYEDLYCARGDMENRIKEQQLDLFADRTSTQTMRANQIRLYFSSFAYVLPCALRRLGLTGTELARAQCGSIRLKLLKIGAQVRISVRRVWLSFSESYPYAELFRQVLQNLRAPPAAAGTAGSPACLTRRSPPSTRTVSVRMPTGSCVPCARKRAPRRRSAGFPTRFLLLPHRQSPYRF